MRDRDAGKVRIDGFHNLIIVVGEFLKLEIKIVQPGDKLRLRRVAFDNDELLVEGFTINRLRLCSSPALQSNSLKRMFCSSLSRKEYL